MAEDLAQVLATLAMGLKKAKVVRVK